jgi:hypothetical protein
MFVCAGLGRVILERYIAIVPVYSFYIVEFEYYF